MIYVAKISEGLVELVTVHPDDYEPAEGEALIGRENTVGVGWAWDGERFSRPDVEMQ